MRHALAPLALGVCLACGGSSPPPTPAPGPGPGPGAPGNGGTITGRERIGWVQQALDAAELATFDYAIYVDGTRRVLEGDTCAPSSGSGFDCSAPLPPLTPGPHSLELAAFTGSDSAIIESPRSAALQVTVAAGTAPAASAAPQDSTILTSDGLRFRASIVARGLDDPSDLAVSPDGRVFVAERAGRVRVVEREGLREPAALELDGVASSPDSGLTALALHPEFDRNGYIYLAYAVDPDAPSIRIARFRERNGILAQGAVVSRERAESEPANVLLRFGVDRRLYAGFAAGADAANAASVSGKILRLNEDGTTPRDNPRGSTTFSSGHRDPRALAWHPATGAMWELERNGDAGDELNAIVGGADYGWPLASGTTSHARSVPAALVLPAGTNVAGAAFVPLESGSPLAGELLVASYGAEDLLRIRADGSATRPGLIEGMLQGRYGHLAAVGVAADGAIYVATANRETWGRGADVLIRLSAVTR